MDLLNGQPVCVLNGNEFMPIEGESFKKQVDEYFESQGRVANRPFGDVIRDMKGIKNDISHGIGRLKSSSFAAVKDVLENGVVINPMAQYHTNGKKNPTGMIAAPIQIGNEKYVCVVEVIANTQIQRLYVHEVTLTKNLQRVVADTTAVHRDDAPVTQPKGEIAKVLQNYLITKEKERNTENNQNIKTESRQMNRKKRIRLTETQLHNVIKECVQQVLSEGEGAFQAFSPISGGNIDMEGVGNNYWYIKVNMGGFSDRRRKVFLQPSDIKVSDVTGLLQTKDGQTLHGTSWIDDDYCTPEMPYSKWRDENGVWKTNN